jgi:hypothetical protein
MGHVENWVSWVFKKTFKICLLMNNKTSELSYTGQRGWYQKQHVKWKDNNIKEDNLLSVKRETS